ncbi:MAG: glycosyltransferase family 87 protein, partial [Anaerolineae bacterium]
PWFCLLFVPLTVLPYQAARALWLLVNLALFIFCLEWLRQTLDWRSKGWQYWGACSVATLMLAAYSLRSEQVGVILLLGLVVVLNSIAQQRPVVGGLGLAIALTKPQVTGLTILFLSFWLLQRSPGFLAWGVAWIATLTALASVIVPRWWLVSRRGFWLGLRYHLTGPGRMDSIRVNSTLYDFLTHVWRVPPMCQYLAAFLAGVAALIVTYLAWSRIHDVAAVTSASTLLTLLLTPYALQYDYVPLTIPLFWAFSKTHSLRSVERLAVAALLSFSFSVLVWQRWSYQGYYQLLGIFGAFSVALVSVVRSHHRDEQMDRNRIR